MTISNENKIIGLRVRLHKLKNNGKNVDSPGVMKKLERKIRRLEQNAER